MGLNKLYPFECIKIEGEEEKVMNLYRIMQNDGKEKGYTPIIIIEDEHGLMEENMLFAKEDFGSFANFTKSCLSEYPKILLKDFFDEKKLSYEGEEMPLSEDDEIFYEEANSVYLGEKVENVYIAKIPTDKPYEVMAYIPMGGFNDCPENTMHIALAKQWYEQYGAYPICIGNDTIQFGLEKPVKAEEMLENLVEEQFLYCPDIVW